MKALLVDDHSLVRHGMEMLLTMRLGFDTVYHAENSAEVLAALEQSSDLNLILLDYKLGDENGLTVLAQIKAKYPQIPVAMMSGEQQVQPIVQALGEGAAGFIPKNLSPKGLAGALEMILAGKIYVPRLKESAAEQQVSEAVSLAEQQMTELAEAARRLIRDRDFSYRMPSSSSSEVSSAFNSLLEELQHDRTRLEELAFSDALTGLANRRLFLDRAELGLRHARRNKTLVGLMYLDLDGFKQLNDKFGHEAGDRVLIEVGRRMSTITREVDTVARLGGDEFTAVLLDINNAEEATIMVERIYRAIVQPVKFDMGNSWQPGVSIGVSLSNGHEELKRHMNRADELMYRVKASGKNHFLIEASAPRPAA